MIKFFGKEYTGSYFRGANPDSDSVDNIRSCLGNSPYIYQSDFHERCAAALDEEDAQLLQLKEDLAKVERYYKSELHKTKDAINIVDTAIKRRLLSAAWDIGYEGGQEDLIARAKCAKGRKANGKNNSKRYGVPVT